MKINIDEILKKFARITSSGDFIPEIDGLRFFAVISVILFHINEYILSHCSQTVKLQAEKSFLNVLLSQGHYGVPLFFVISGFILSQQFAQKCATKGTIFPLTKYYLRRITRLEPPYFANLIVIFFFMIFISGENVFTLIKHLFFSLFYLHNAVYLDQSLINGVAWSLEVEVQFYLLAPFLSLIFLLRSKFLRRAILSFAIIVFAFFFGTRQYHLFFVGSANYLLAGFLLTDIYLFDWKRKVEISKFFDIIGIILAFLILFIMINKIYPKFLLPFLFLFLYICFFKGVFLNKIARNKYLLTIGGMCYTTYLYHFQFVALLGRIQHKIFPLQDYISIVLSEIIVSVPIVIVSCGLLFRALEKPFMVRDWHLKLIQKLKR